MKYRKIEDHEPLKVGDMVSSKNNKEENETEEDFLNSNSGGWLPINNWDQEFYSSNPQRRSVLIFKRLISADSAQTTKQENNMKAETAKTIVKTTGSFLGKYGWKALNYWVLEPAVNISRPIVKTVRYATFVTVLATAGYGYNNPEAVKNFLASCIPTITFEAPEILK